MKRSVKPVLAKVDRIPRIIRGKKMSERKGKFELFEGTDGQWYFNLLAGNGEVIATSEGYRSKQMAERGIMSVRRNAPGALIEEKGRKYDLE